ncbi:SixA phosphatase family protein [Carboxylicivirga linearis]|uniref:Histidine phosphatase family protein n=1 Tax=Carboxylicivirga linearis TaxID=1628157 RepID=A0ABS5JWA9_9BACT|nr:histidine phosphatase family protein [Carboxylicivirga linearis]MBS2098636.1 histidine phosphatase family protein [Carboxylicivirga linearis]
MKRLIFVRHAKTEQLDYGSTKTDYQRELKPRGFKDSEIISEKLIKMNAFPDYILSSSAKRAKQTAKHIAKHIDFDTEQIDYQRFIYDGYTTTEFLTFLEKFNQHETIMVVGHNPEIAMIAMNLSDGDYYHFPTCAATAITFDAENWSDVNAREGKPEWFIYPSMFKQD